MTLTRDYVQKKAADCYYEFTNSQAAEELGISAVSVKERMRRARNDGLIATPVRSFNVVMSPHHIRAKGPPLLFYIDQLMKHLNQPYYLALLSAADMYGAAHQKPMVSQAIVTKARAPISCGRSRIEFTVKKNLEMMPIKKMNTERGTVRVSTPEVTAFDIVGYKSKAVGLDNVATILIELSESIKVRELAAVAKLHPVAWSQRLGYLFEFIGENRLARPLAIHVKNNASVFTPLDIHMPTKNHTRNRKWKLVVNSEVEPDIEF